MPETALDTLGKRLEWARREMAWREGRNVSPSTLSYLIFLPDPTVAQWEKDIGEPSAEELALIAHVLGVNAHWLATGQYA